MFVDYANDLREFVNKVWSGMPISNRDKDGRINSLDDENAAFELLRTSPETEIIFENDQKFIFKHGECQIEWPKKPRKEYDFLFASRDSNMQPVQFKSSSAGNAPDNAFNAWSYIYSCSDMSMEGLLDLGSSLTHRLVAMLNMDENGSKENNRDLWYVVLIKDMNTLTAKHFIICPLKAIPCNAFSANGSNNVQIRWKNVSDFTSNDQIRPIGEHRSFIRELMWGVVNKNPYVRAYKKASK